MTHTALTRKHCAPQLTERPNPGVNRSAKRRRRLVPTARRAPAPGYASR